MITLVLKSSITVYRIEINEDFPFFVDIINTKTILHSVPPPPTQPYLENPLGDSYQIPGALLQKLV
jgi:hypothetical protein